MTYAMATSAITPLIFRWKYDMSNDDTSMGLFDSTMKTANSGAAGWINTESVITNYYVPTNSHSVPCY